MTRSPVCAFFFNDTATTEIYTPDTLFPYTTLFRSLRDCRKRRRKQRMAQRPGHQSQRLFQRKSRDPSCRAFPRHAYVVEGQYAVADDLPLFMPLASYQNNVVSTRLSKIGRAQCRARVCQNV